jgi:hypothetical protein
VVATNLSSWVSVFQDSKLVLWVGFWGLGFRIYRVHGVNDISAWVSEALLLHILALEVWSKVSSFVAE